MFAEAGSPLVTPGLGDPSRGSVPPGTWEEVVVDLSDYKGQEIVIRFTQETLQDLTIQAGRIGWLIDDVSVIGCTSTVDPAIALQVGNPTTVDVCGLVADFETTSADCHGETVQLFDRHEGLGDFSGGVPIPLTYEWRVGPYTIGPGAPGVAIGGAFGGAIDPTSTYDNPRVNLAAGGQPPGIYPVQMIVRQGADTYTANQTIVYKDAPVPAILLTSSAFAGSLTRFSSDVTFNTMIDADRNIVYEWDFGDGTPVVTAGAEVEHVFEAPGDYTVRLRVYDEDGCNSSTTQVSLPGGGTANQVTVTAGPTFQTPTAVFVSDCAPGHPGQGDGDGDLNEYVTISVGFTNSGANATGVVGYLTSPDPEVEITRSAADYGNVMSGQVVGGQPFTFIRHPVAGETCVSVPFALTLVSNGTTVVQAVNFTFTLGGAMDAPFSAAPIAETAFCQGNELRPPFTFTVGPGCLSGLELDITLRATLTTLDRLQVRLESPDFESHVILVDGGAPRSNGPFNIHFRFATNGVSGAIADTDGLLFDIAGTMDDTLEAELINSLPGVSMQGDWKLHVEDTQIGGCPPSFYVTLNAFHLEGTTSRDLDSVPMPPACSACLVGAAPVFDGSRVVCTPPVPNGLVQWSPPVDTSSCAGDSDVTYELYASTTPGQLGTRIDNNPARIVTGPAGCSTGLCTDGQCAYDRDPDSTQWQVCNAETVYWTVIAVDGTAPGPRTPNISAPGDPVPAGYQTPLVSCLVQPDPPTHVIREVGTTGLEIAFIVPSPQAETYRVFRGTFDVDANGSPRMLATRGVMPYDHAVLQCAFPAGTTYPINSDRTDGGQYYYLVPAVNRAACVGAGLDSFGAQRPTSDTCTDPFDPADCSP